MLISNTVVGIPDNIKHPQVSLFNNYYDTKPICTVSLWQFLLTLCYKDEVQRYRKCRNVAERKGIKNTLPCVTVSGEFDTRSKKRLKHLHCGYICIDIDGKQNKEIVGRDWFTIKKKLANLFDSLAYAGMSISGNGLCLIFKIAYPEKHREHFNALVAEIRERTGLVADESCGDVARLRGASYDAYPHFNPYAEEYVDVLSISGGKSCRNIPKDRTIEEQHLINKRVARLIYKIRQKKLAFISDTSDPEYTLRMVGCALAAEYGRIKGHDLFHMTTMWHPDYYPSEWDRIFMWCMGHCDRTEIATFFYVCKKYGVTFK